MVHRFCPQCGKTVTNLVHTDHGFCCDDCVGTKSVIFELDDRFDYYECVSCHKASATGLEPWISLEEKDPQDRLRELILRLFLLRFFKNARVQADVDFPDYVTLKEKAPPFEASIFIEECGGDHPRVQQHTLFVKPHYTVCITCSRKKGNYYTAIVQIRGEPLSEENKKQAILEDVMQFAERLEKKNEEMFVTKIIDKDFGIDLQLSSLELATLIANHLKNRYGAKLEESKRLMGRGGDSGGELYRHTIAVRLLPFQKQFAILFDGELCIVRAFQSKFTFLFSLSRNLEFKTETKNLFSHPVNVVAKPDNFLQFEVISDDGPYLHLTNRQTGETVTEIKKNFDFLPPMGAILYAVAYQDKIYFIPARVYGERR